MVRTKSVIIACIETHPTAVGPRAARPLLAGSISVAELESLSMSNGFRRRIEAGGTEGGVVEEVAAHDLRLLPSFVRVGHLSVPRFPKAGS